MANATGFPQKNYELVKPSASLQKMWIDYDVMEGSRYGMLIHIAFTAYDMKGMTAYLGAYFRYNDGNPNNPVIHAGKRIGPYHTKEGHLALGKDITPTYDASVYEDVQLFFPYDEFDLPAGVYELTIDVQLLYKDGGGTIAWLKQYDIEYTSSDKSRSSGNVKGTIKTRLAPTTGPRATFDKMWVDHNVVDANGVKGMNIHFKFIVYDMKDREAQVAVYFDYNDGIGGSLKDKNKRYYTKNGYVAVFKTINPGFTTTNYDDLTVFMPNAELDLDPGDYNLAFEAMLLNMEGGLITKFGWLDFVYNYSGK